MKKVENKPSERSRLSLDRVLSEIAELENSRGEPERIWSLGDIDELLESTQNGIQPVLEDETDLLAGIEYYEDRYSDSGVEPEPEYSAYDDKPSEPEQAEAKTVDIEPVEPEQGENEPAEIESEPTFVPEEHTEEPEQTQDASCEQETKDEPADNVLSLVADDESVSKDESYGDADENGDSVFTAPEEPEDKKPTVAELFGTPASKYFGDGAAQEEQEENQGIPGLFDSDTVIFSSLSSAVTPPEGDKKDDEYKTKLISAIGAVKNTGSEPIEKPGVILKRGPLSETSGLEPLPQVIPAEEFVGGERINENQPFTDPVAQQPEEEQLVFSGFGDEPEPEKVDEDALRDELDKKREEKKKKFVLLSNFDGEDADKDVAAETENEPETKKQSEKTQEEKIKGELEYETPEQRGRVYSALKGRVTQFKTSVVGLCVIEAVTLLLLLVPKVLEWFALDTPAFGYGGAGLAVANIIFLIASVYLAFPSIASGIKALSKGRATGDCAAAIAALLALVQAIISFFNKSPEGAAGSFYCSAAVFVLLLSTVGGYRNAARVMRNFLFCTAKRRSGLYAIRNIENEKDAFEVGRALKMGNPDILYSGRIDFPSEFIKSSEANSSADGCVKLGLIISSAASALLAIIAGIMTKDAFQAIGVLTGAFCLTAPCAADLAMTAALCIEGKTLNDDGGMVAGYDAALECSEAVAAAVDSADLFDRAACEMHGMKDFKTVRIDDVLLYAVAMVLKSGGPLTDVFNRIISGSTELLPPVRDMIYEDRLGLSATIYNQRVLLGNRNLLTHHNIEVPLKSEEDKVKRNGRKVLYIAIDSQVAAMFVFNYVEDESLKDSINEMSDNGFSLVVRTDDPNVTDELIAARFGILQKDIKITLSQGARIFSAYRDSVTPQAPAKVLHDGSARSYFKSIAACGRLANFVSHWNVLSLVIQAVIAVGAVISVALKAFSLISPAVAVVIQAAVAVLGIVVEKYRR